jgi:hypothetical protein
MSNDRLRCVPMVGRTILFFLIVILTVVALR